jgi:murein DD-endopeptidase MepM/ murein hydrolase activator NlpD
MMYSPNPLARIWADIVAAGWHEPIFRYAGHAVLLTVIVAGVLLSRLDLPELPQFEAERALDSAGPIVAPEALVAQLAPDADDAVAPSFGQVVEEGVILGRDTSPQTFSPALGRSGESLYTVAVGDTLSGIAARFGLRPETVLYSNVNELGDDVDRLQPGMTLRILPADGLVHRVSDLDTVETIAAQYAVTVEAIMAYPGNGLDPVAPRLTVGRELVVPGGQRALGRWQFPDLPRTDLASAAVEDFGQCPGGYTGVTGSGSLVWPSATRRTGGEGFSVIHPAIEIAAPVASEVLAADAGVVTYVGPVERGYGRLIYLDHGDGLATLYADLGDVRVDCGASVEQGGVIALVGNEAFHFEVRRDGLPVDPLLFLP